MKTVERIFQAIFFEITVLSIIIPSSVIIGGFDPERMTIVAIAISLFAMLWNYIYNLVFDKLIGFNRLARGLVLRISHAVCFELGMVVITLPVMAWYLEITLLAAAILEAAFLIFILIYTLVFNWLYDRYQPYQKWFSKQVN
ncbi:PACE efflux transporter [Marinomonas colpomeniae]|uniref:PACE efflux transporter n=1 Tax=Marinomonas colpomeniae TaxID=2774408 RepID=A0ABR8P4X8_9GAMM|nr:PACE efflux transporter [Marinomonas colpomeniae]MBD5772427.1 PACE efflux transporter [Marinomonas colpomeniae]